MAKRRGNGPKRDPSGKSTKKPANANAKLDRQYDRARELATQGRLDHAIRCYDSIKNKTSDHRLRALIQNDVAAIEAARGDTDKAIKGFKGALATDEQCEPARLNLRLLEVDREFADGKTKDARREPEGKPGPLTPGPSPPEGRREDASVAQLSTPQPSTRVAILSFLFNWPSTGGGIVHTVELAEFLRRAGYDVKHFYARHLPWGVGKVEGVPPFPSEAIEFDDTSWHMPVIQERFRRAVDAFGPDYVLVTDSWNSKPLLAEAVREYPYILRLQALECLCPLNNVRLLPVMETGTGTNGTAGCADRVYGDGSGKARWRDVEVAGCEWLLIARAGCFQSARSGDAGAISALARIGMALSPKGDVTSQSFSERWRRADHSGAPASSFARAT